MSKVRAYKIAEELGIDRTEFVERARDVGIELKSAMATLDDDQIEQLREKLGEKKGVVTESRVEGRKGVIRRRRAVPKPPPEPEPVPVPETIVASEPAADMAAPAEPVEPEPAPEQPQTPEEVAVPTPAARPSSQPATPASTAADAAPADRKGRQRKRVREVVNLKEQEQIARQVTSRTTQRRSVSIDPRAFQSPRRKRRDGPKPAAVATQAPKAAKRVVRIDGSISVSELARQLGAKAADVQARLMAAMAPVWIRRERLALARTESGTSGCNHSPHGSCADLRASSPRLRQWKAPQRSST